MASLWALAELFGLASPKPRRYHPVPRLIAPPDAHPIDPGWWAPLEAVARVSAGQPHYAFFDPADFMLMGRIVRRSPRADLLLYKHWYTRRYLNLDQAGHAYRFVPPRALHRSGRYLHHGSLADALDALGLWELPWMKPSLGHLRGGLSWHERSRLRVGVGGQDSLSSSSVAASAVRASSAVTDPERSVHLGRHP
jgi:hypothetical protein